MDVNIKMSSIDCTKRVIRVKRKANEEKSLPNVPNKRCKYVGSCDTSDAKHVYQLLVSTLTLPPNAVTDDEENALEITDYEHLDDSKGQHNSQQITCNGMLLESVDNDLSQTFDYIYDIYVYEENQTLDCEQNDYRECDDEEVSSNDENYQYNDYPEEHEVSDEVFDYYNYRDHENDSQRDLRLHFDRTGISSDYDLSDEEISDKYGKYRKNSSDYSSDGDDEQEDDL